MIFCLVVTECRNTENWLVWTSTYYYLGEKEEDEEERRSLNVLFMITTSTLGGLTGKENSYNSIGEPS